MTEVYDRAFRIMRNPMPPVVEILTGPPAFSAARLSATRAELAATAAQVDDVFAEFVHFLFVAGDLSSRDRTTVEALLSYGPRRHRPVRLGEPLCTVVPRPGTISPWSSKATDIFRRCGLAAVVRVERGVRWYVQGRCPRAAVHRGRGAPARPYDRGGGVR